MSLKNLSLQKKLFVFMLPIFVMLFTVLILNSYLQIRAIKKDVYNKEKLFMKKDIEDKVKSKLELLKNIVAVVSSDSIITQAMDEDDREKLFNEIAKIRKNIIKIKSFKDPKIQIVDSMGFSYVKSWDKNSYGADTNNRDSVKFVRKRKQPYSG